MANNNLHDAKAAKKDEFYTCIEDISNELRHYRDFFRGKSVLCVATCYDGSPVAGSELRLPFDDYPKPVRLRTAYKIVITEVPDLNGDGATDMADVDMLIRNRANVLTRLNGNGDFRSPECVAMLREADVVVTNPPFSLFREYLAQLIKYDKKFLIIGNLNAITTKDIFPLIMTNKVWFGPSITSGDRAFRVPDDYPLNASTCGIDSEGYKFIRIKGVRWYTNIDHKKRHEEIELYKMYSQEEYQTFDNYNAININKTSDIPYDYDGVMGVPITFMDKYNPEQFEIIGLTQIGCHDLVPDTRHYDDYVEVNRSTGKATGASGRKTNENAVIAGEGNKKTFYRNAEGHIVHSEYKRVLIRKKKN